MFRSIMRFAILFCLLYLVILPHLVMAQAVPGKVIRDTATVYDSQRSRAIPIAVYTTMAGQKQKHRKVVILNHGYGQNRGGDYLQYSYIAEHLAEAGFYVVSIQHELPTDSLMPLTGIPQIVRRSNWERGVANILFVLTYLERTHPEPDRKTITLIGHSNGGDMAMLFATLYPQWVHKVISLDNRRVSLPRSRNPAVYSLRSSDQPADEGVLPDEAEQKKYHMTIVRLPATPHNDMDDDASAAQRSEINCYIRSFLSQP